MNRDMEKILISERQIGSIVKRISAEIDRDYQGKKLILLGILKGSVVFLADLMKSITVPAEIEFMKVSYYGSGTHSSGNIRIHYDIHREDLSDCDILIVEDIVDSGRTLSYLVQYLKDRGAKSVRTCTLLDKPSRRVVEYNADYVGKIIPDEFVVGYGLDYDEQFRALPYIGVLKPEVYRQ